MVLSNKGRNNLLFMNKEHIYTQNINIYKAHSIPWMMCSAGQLAQWAKSLAARLMGLSFFPGTHMIEGDNKPLTNCPLIYMWVGSLVMAHKS